MYCRFCGKDVGNAAWCPYCGAKQSDDGQTNAQNGSGFQASDSQNAWGEQINLSAPAPKTNTFAIVGLILSFFSSMLGLIFSIIGLTKAKEYGSGKGIAIAGIVVSIASIVLSLIMTAIMLPQLEQILLELARTA